jgi:exosortase A-associated hydrolase 1
MGTGLRAIVTIRCKNDLLVAALDGPAEAETGWLFVVGGTQTRVGPHRLYERLAQRLSTAGHAVIRFDRRGVGDSSGIDPGYQNSGADMAAALKELQSKFPKLNRIFGFGLCDGASAIARAGECLSGAVLANPWVIEPTDDLPPTAAIRGHYRRRLLAADAWKRLLSGSIDFGRLARGLLRLLRREDDSLVRRFADGLLPNSQIVLSEGDGTAQAFAAAWKELQGAKPEVTITMIATASHSFADPSAFESLAQVLLDYSAATASSDSKSDSAR